MIGFGDEDRAFESRARSEPFDPAEDAPTAFSDTMKAAFSLTQREELSSSAGNARFEANRKRADAIEKLGGDKQLAIEYNWLPPPVLEDFKRLEAQGSPLDQSYFWGAIQPRQRDAYTQMRKYTTEFPSQVMSDEGMMEEFKKQAASLRAVEQDTMQRGSGWASFLGQGGAILTDPLVLATLPLGGWEGAAAGGTRTILGTAARTAASEGAIAVATEIPIQAEVLRFKRELESPWTFKDSAMNVLAAGVGGAAIGGVLGGGSVAAKRLLERYREAKAAGQTITPEMQDAADALEQTVALQAQNPLGLDGVPAEEVHERAFDTARAQESIGEPIDVAGVVRGVEPIDDLDLVSKRVEDPAQLVDIDPLTVKTDAQTFQFKQGGNTEGVTDALKDVESFDRRLAGVSLVWERADGTRFVADGHQRLALARRALAAGQDPAEVRLNGFLLREADGISAADARRIAAVKNMAEGSGSALDAAKILRDVGKFGETLLPPLPPRSTLVRQARGLANLDEESFRQVVNEVIPANYGALVGAATADPKLQSAMVDVLRRTNPANETQARSIVDQVRTQGVDTRTTEDLFGEKTFSESLYLERAQVLDEALKQSRKDSAVFGRLLSEESRIERAGTNRLDREANQTRLQEAKDAITKFTALANSRGPVSDALTAAARRVREGERAGNSATAFLEAVRSTLIEGDRAGQQTRLPRPGGEAPLARESVIPKADDLSASDRQIEQRFAEQLEGDVDGAIAAYEKLPDAEGGKVLAGDVARELSPDYLADRTKSAAVQEPSSWLIKEMYRRRLAAPLRAGEEPLVVFSAGGTGAGKTTGLKALERSNPDVKAAQIVYDSNLSSFGSAVQRIDQALAADKQVQVLYTYRDPEEALVEGVLKRAMKQEAQFGTGRTVPIDVHAKTHVDSRDVIERLARHYKDRDGVAFRFIDNSRGRGKAAIVKLEELPQLEYTRVRENSKSALESQYRSGAISDSIYRGVRGEEPAQGRNRVPGGQNRPGRGGQPEQQGARGRVETGDRPTIDAPPRPIVRQAESEKLGTPSSTKTGTVSDEDYSRVMSAYMDLIDKEGEFARVVNDVNGQLEQRSVRAVIEELDQVEDTLERIRLCSAPTREAA